MTWNREEELAQALAIMEADVPQLTQPDRVTLVLSLGLPQALSEVITRKEYRERALEHTTRVVSEWSSKGLNATTILDGRYPESLSAIREAPLLVFHEGTLLTLDPAIAIVGSRNASALAREASADLARATVELGVSVVSGLAAGVDTAAHASTITHGGRTVAFMGTDITTTYPHTNRGLREEIVRSGGAIISQFLPGRAPGRAAFPMRNVCMSGYSIGSVIVTAQEDSGTRHQAQRALKHGRPVILLPHVAGHVSWAKALVGQPNVYVVESIDAYKHVVEKLAASRRTAMEALPV